MTYHIAIAGAGTTGLALAGFLRAGGHEVSIFERFDKAMPVGAGLLIQPTGLAVMARLGIDKALIARSAPIKTLYGKTHTGRTIFDLNYNILGRHIFGLGVHRASLFQVLHDHAMAAGAVLHTGCEAQGATTHPDGLMSLKTVRGEDFGPFDLIVDCTGRHSKLAERHARIRMNQPYPYGAFWGVCRDPGQDFGRDSLQQRYHAARVMIGTLAIGKRPGEEDDHIAFFWSLPHRDLEAVRGGGIDVWKEKVTGYWPEMAPFIAQMHGFEDLTFAEYGHKALASRVQGRLVFAGDAAHAMSPQLGQGANLGLIDACVLGEAINSHSGLDDALNHYQSARKDHLGFYHHASQWMTPFFQGDGHVAPWLRDLLFGPMCYMPWMKDEMMRTLAGMKTGLFSHIDPGHWHEDYRIGRRRLTAD